MSGQGKRPWSGRALRRVEDAPLLKGGGRFVDDISLPGCLHMAVVRSPYARARIAARGLDEARQAPHVRAVISGADVAHLGELPVNRVVPDMTVPRYPVLADGDVMAVGEPVAAVVAETLAGALDAADLVDVEYDVLEPVLDPSGCNGSPPLFEALPDNEALAQDWRTGDVEAVFRSAHATVRLRIEHSRLAPVSLEPRATLADWDSEAGSLTVWTSTQTPHRARQDLARILGLDETQVRAIAPDVGGAFGMKASIYPEDVLAAWAAMQLGRPVKWTATRGEDMLAGTHGRGTVTEGELALARDGAFLGLRARVVCPLGHWLPYSAGVPAWNAGRILPGPYRVETVGISSRARVTNTAPVGIYRGAGRPEATMLMERLVDEAARTLEIDPVELRRRNFIPAEAFPYTTPTGEVLDSGDYAHTLERACGRARYPSLRAEQAERRARGELFGVGLAFYVEPCGRGWESAQVRLEADGRITAATGSSSQGQGRETAFAQIVADVLGVPAAAVAVEHGDTATCPTGIGALASRSTAIGGSALALAAKALREKAQATAAVLLQAAPEAVRLGTGGFEIHRDPGRRVSWQAVAEAAAGATGDKGAGGLEGAAVFDVPTEAWACGCCVAAVLIDRDTGVLTVERIVWVDDAGEVVNPLLVDGQVVGGVAQGLGEALMEHIVYDGDGQLLTGSLMDYAVPRARDMPEVAVERTVTRSPNNPLGAKGVGEAGTIGAPAAVVNAAVDALRPFGVRHLDMPLTSERIWRAMQDASCREWAK